MKFLRLLSLCFITSAALAADKPKAPAGYVWKTFEDVFCEVQVPDGWFQTRRSAGLTKAVLLSPEKIEAGKGIDTGFTMNAVKCKTQAEWKEAMLLVGKVMSDNREATEHPIDSRVEEKKDMLFMVIEGERFIADSPHPNTKYHVRTIVRAFPQFATIYMYSFGAPADKWDGAWKTGGVMLSPIWFNLSK